MQGAVLRQEREYDLVIAQGWHAARFNALAQTGKLRGLATYIGKRASGKRSQAADALAFFHSMKAKGFPVEITRVPREPSDG